MNQQSKKIQNPEMQVPKTPQMNERDYINDILSCAKMMTNNYSVALNEMSNDKLYQDVSQIFNETQNCQRELYNTMFRKGFYGLEAEDQQKLDQSHQQFAGYSSQFPYQQ